MNRHCTAFLVSIALVASARKGHAQDARSKSVLETRTTSTDTFLDGLVAEALRSNPDVALATASSESAHLRIQPAQTLPDPSLAFNYQNDGRTPSLGGQEITFLGAMFSQPLPWPGKLRLAGEVGTKPSAEAAEGPVRRARLAIEARVRRAYYEYLLAREGLELVEEAIFHGAVKRVRPKVMTVACAFFGLVPIMWSTGAGADVMKRIAAPMIGGLFTSFLMELLVYPAIYLLWKWREVRKAALGPRSETLTAGPAPATAKF